MQQLRIAIAGSSQYSCQMAQVLIDHPQFDVIWILTPGPKAVGRHQQLLNNPLTIWADKQQLDKFLVNKTINEPSLKNKLQKQSIDLLLVVDFGYLIPPWLLNLPKIAPLNIHPSLLPRWRGSSPGQFAILFQNFQRAWRGQIIGGQNSAITLMLMNEQLDQGNIIHQELFMINRQWTQQTYYQQAFQLMAKILPEKILAFSQGKISTQAQSENSPTPIARKLNRSDGFVGWSIIKALQTNKDIKINKEKTALLANLLNGQGCLGTFPLNYEEKLDFVINACQAFNPWPGLWTIINTTKGKKRLKILSCHLAKTKNEIKKSHLVLDRVQIEGKNPCSFSAIKNIEI